MSRIYWPVSVVLLLAWADFLPSKSATAQDNIEPQRYALLVAVTTYSHAEMNQPALEYPEIDAKAVGEFLSEHGYEVEYMLGRNAKQKDIQSKLEELASKGNQPGAVFVGMWGHGVEFEGSDEAMFCPYDAKIRLAKDSQGNKLFNEDGQPMLEPNPESLVGMSHVLTGLKLSGAGNRILIADCCRNSPNRARGRAFGSKVKISDLPNNTAAIFACKANEQAFEDKVWGHGAMTKGLLDLLPGLATQESSDVASIAGRLRSNVNRMVRTRSNGRDSQTVQPIFRGLPEFKFESSVLPKLLTNGIGMKLTLIPSGEFLMGSPADEEGRSDVEEQHRVQITKSFYMQTTEVTQGQWTSVMNSEPWDGKDNVKEGYDYAASYVSWDDAVEFCRKLTESERSAGRLTTNQKYTLPTEAQWEYACRAGSTTRFSFGDDESKLKDFAWFEGNAYDIGEEYTHRVGQKRPNAFGLYDMHGNVYELCLDRYAEDYYANSPGSDPSGPSSGSNRVARGGSWFSRPQFARSAYRLRPTPDYRDYYLGFRVAFSPVQ